MRDRGRMESAGIWATGCAQPWGRWVALGAMGVLAAFGLGARAEAQSAPAAGARVLSMQSGAAQDSAAQNTEPGQLQLMQPPAPAGPPMTITLKDALTRAQKNDSDYLAAVNDAKSAKEDRIQARNAILPTISFQSQALLTQGNGATSIGRFVTNDGVHVYRSWGVLHEDLSPANYLGATLGKARADEAVAKAKAEIAKRGLTVTVTKDYYALAAAQRKYATAQAALDTAKQFFDNTSAAERVGQVAHSDVIQAEIQYRQQKQAFDDAKLDMETARMELAVLLFPVLNENFTVVDDMDSVVALPGFSEAEAMASHQNPDLEMAMQSLKSADAEVKAGKGAFLPAFFTDSIYGIEANDYALHSVNVEFPEDGVLPNLGYFITVGVNVPVWDWGTLRSKLHQAEFKRESARVELSQTQREILSTLYNSYNEALTAQQAVKEARETADLAAESLRLINLRYKAGESSALEVVSAENSLTQAQNAYSDAEVRYRTALATLQTVTGAF
jgi:outer membrane protein TolC